MWSDSPTAYAHFQYRRVSAYISIILATFATALPLLLSEVCSTLCRVTWMAPGTWNTIRVLIVTTTIHCYKSGRRKYYMGVAETVHSTHTCHVAIIAVLSMQAVQSLLLSKGDRTIGCSSTLLSPL